MNIQVVLEFDEAVGSFAAWCPELPGCASAGETEAEALANAREAIALYFDPAPLHLEAGARVHEIEFP